MQNAVLGSVSFRRRARVVFPAPDGAEIMNRSPLVTGAVRQANAPPRRRRPIRHDANCIENPLRSHPVLFNILDLFAHLLDKDLEIQGSLRELGVEGL